MTGYTESDFHHKAQEVNHIAYFEKPVEVYEIEPVIESIFNSRISRPIIQDLN
jgi:hypothetical protein